MIIALQQLLGAGWMQHFWKAGALSGHAWTFSIGPVSWWLQDNQLCCLLLQPACHLLLVAPHAVIIINNNKKRRCRNESGGWGEGLFLFFFYCHCNYFQSADVREVCRAIFVFGGTLKDIQIFWDWLRCQCNMMNDKEQARLTDYGRLIIVTDSG